MISRSRQAMDCYSYRLLHRQLTAHRLRLYCLSIHTCQSISTCMLRVPRSSASRYESLKRRFFLSGSGLRTAGVLSRKVRLMPNLQLQRTLRLHPLLFLSCILRNVYSHRTLLEGGPCENCGHPNWPMLQQ